MTQISTHDVIGLRVGGFHYLDSGAVSLTVRTVHEEGCEREPVDIVLFFTDDIPARAFRDAITTATRRIDRERHYATTIPERAAESKTGA